MLKPFGQDIWIAEGPVIAAAMGFHYPTRMSVIHLGDGGVLVISPIALGPDLEVAINALGPVSGLVAPNSLHHVFLANWHAAYPAARLYGAPGVAQKRPELSFDAELDERAPALWSGQVEQIPVHGNAITTEIVFYHRASRTVLFTDLLQNLPPELNGGWRQAVARLDLMVRPEPTVPRKFRFAMTDRQAAAKAMRQILDWPAEQVLMAHGTPVTAGGQAFLKRAFRWLVDTP